MDDWVTKPDQGSEDQRLAALADMHILDTPAETRFDDLVAMVAAICDRPIALVSLVDRDRQWFKAKHGVEVGETPLRTSVCALAIQQDELFEIEDLSKDPRTCDFSLVTDPPHIRFYAGYPIMGPGGNALGSLCAIDYVPRPGGLTDRQAVALEALARQTALEIERGAGARRIASGQAGPRSIGMWDWDVRNDRVVADAGMAILYDVDPVLAEQGLPVAEFFGGIHPDDVAQTRAAVNDALVTGDSFMAEHRIRDAGGAWRWMAAQGRCEMAPDGTPLRFPGVSYDIDARKSSELRMSALVELGDRLRAPGDAAGLAYALAEVIGRTLGATRVGYGIVDPIAETIYIERQWCGRDIRLLPEHIHFRNHGSFIDDLKRGETVVIGDIDRDPRTNSHSGPTKALQVSSLVNLPIIENDRFVALLFVHQDRPRMWSREEIAFVRDVAERTRVGVERRRAEQELEALNASLEAQVEARTRELQIAEDHLRQAQKMEAVGQLTGGLAHDFNNLLTGISGAIQMMEVRIAQGRIGELDRYIAAAQGAATRAAALTHRLLAFSRRQTLAPRAVDVARLIAGIDDLIRRTVGPSVGLEVDARGGLWTALVDPNQLENALLNLAINARDAMPHGGTIRIVAENMELVDAEARAAGVQPGRYLAVSVIDSGIGMSPEVQERAFDPFYTTKPLGQGTGLGLSMIYGFARQSGGSVRITSREGQGTALCILLPRHAGQADPETADSAGDGLGGQAEAARTVLVVDDEPTIRMLVAEVIRELGHEALEAEDGPSAMAILQTGARIELLVTDVGLTGPMNGRQLADAAIARLADLRVLFITGYAESAVIGTRHLEPNMGLLTKPFAMDAMAAKVRALLG